MRRVPTTWQERRKWRYRQGNPYHAAYQKKAAQTITEWRAVYGDVCPGYKVPAHRAFDLTADHLVPISLGGQMMGELSVLCRRCNSKKGGRNRLRRTA